jgi:hypothetical protein
MSRQLLLDAGPWGVQGIPATAVIDRAGKLVYLGRLREALVKAAEILKQP